VEEAVKQADAEGLEADKPTAVARAPDRARGTKAMLRSGVTPDASIDGLELPRDPDAIASYSVLRAVRKNQERPVNCLSAALRQASRFLAARLSQLSKPWCPQTTC
jgi:hypothetical protein